LATQLLGVLFQVVPSWIVLVVDYKSHPAMGYISLHQIDWVSGALGNMGLRIELSWCGKGVGTLVLQNVAKWCFNSGLRTLCLDVAASNPRALRCYEKVGFVRTGEFWRDAGDLKDVDLDQPKYEFVLPHVRLDRAVPQIRFWWMRLEKGGQ
jgi:RimJ/RimL family protein N-acetyltransferase